MNKEDTDNIKRLKEIVNLMIKLNDEAWDIKIKYEPDDGYNCFQEMYAALENRDGWCTDGNNLTFIKMIERIERIIKEKEDREKESENE